MYHCRAPKMKHFSLDWTEDDASEPTSMRVYDYNAES
jgi:hypothetical protein